MGAWSHEPVRSGQTAIGFRGQRFKQRKSYCPGDEGRAI